MFGFKSKSILVNIFYLFLIVIENVSSFHLNVSSSETVRVAEDDDDILTESCINSGDWEIQIPDLNFPPFPAAFLVSRSSGNNRKPAASLALIEDSKTLQTSLLHIARQVANTFKMTNNSAAQLKTLAANVENQFSEVNRCLEGYQNSSDLFQQLIPQPLTNLTESTKKIAQLFYLMATQFEDLFNLTKAVKNSAVKILTKLERAKSGVIRRKASRINSRRKLKMAMQSLRRIIADLTRRLQRDRVELKTTSQEWQSTMKTRMNFTQDDEWADAKSMFERAKWRWNCSRQALNKTQEKLHKWSQLDEELSAAIEESRQENVEIHEEMTLLFNGTRNGSSSSSNIVQLERHRNLTTDFANYYNDAGGFFLGIGTRISNILAGVITQQSANSDEDFNQLKSNLKKIKCDLDRNGRFIILTDGKSPKKDFQRKIVGFVLGGETKENNCDDVS